MCICRQNPRNGKIVRKLIPLGEGQQAYSRSLQESIANTHIKIIIDTSFDQLYNVDGFKNVYDSS